MRANKSDLDLYYMPMADKYELKQVPKDSPGQYFAIEDSFLKEQLTEIKKKHIDGMKKQMKR